MCQYGGGMDGGRGAGISDMSVWRGDGWWERGGYQRCVSTAGGWMVGKVCWKAIAF